MGVKRGFVFVFCLLMYTDVHGQATDQCVDNTDKFELTSSAYGTKVNASSRELRKLVEACEEALVVTPNSTTLRLNLTKALIWAKRESAAMIQMETLMGTDQEMDIVDLSAALCASGGGGSTVTNQTCEWSLELGIDDPDLAEQAAKKRFVAGEPEAGLNFMSQAATGGADSAVKYMTDLCSRFAPNRNPPIARLPSELNSLDPHYVGTLSCEAAFLVADPSTSDWSDYGFKYAEALVYFDEFEGAADTLLDLAQSQDPVIVGGAIDVLDALCTATAGDVNDTDYGDQGVNDIQLMPDRALPVCEAAGFVWPDNGRIQYNLARVYGQYGKEQEDNYISSLDEAIRLGYPLAKQLQNASPVPFNVNQFNVPGFIKAFYDQNIQALNAEPYYALVYAKGLHGVFSQENVIFLGDESAREILLMTDPALGHKAGLKLTNPEFFADSIDKSFQNFLMPLQTFLKSMEKGDDIFKTGKDLIEVGYKTPQAKAELLQQMALQDGRRLVILWETNSEDVKKVYAGLKKFVEYR